MEQAAQTGVRHGIRRALGRALIVAGGTVGGTLLGWAVAAGTAHADPLPVAAVTALAAPSTDAPNAGTATSAAQGGAGAAGAAGAAVLGPAVPVIDPETGALLSGVDGWGPIAAPVRTATAGVRQAITPARDTVHGIAGTLAGGRSTARPATHTGSAGPTGSAGAPAGAGHDANRQSHPVGSAAPSPVGSGVTGPADVARNSRSAGSAGQVTGAQPMSQHSTPRPDPISPFAPPPGAPAPAATTSGPAGTGTDVGWAAAPQQHARGRLATAAHPAPAAGHHAGNSAQQPGVTPD